MDTWLFIQFIKLVLFIFRLINYPVEEGKVGQQVIDKLQIHLKNFGAENVGNFYVCCDTYQSQIPGLYILNCACNVGYYLYNDVQIIEFIQKL